jgi:hypothetical protein
VSVAELEKLLQDRECSMQIHLGAGGTSWVVFLYAPDDPQCWFVGEADVLAMAIADAVKQWDDSPGVETEVH